MQIRNGIGLRTVEHFLYLEAIKKAILDAKARATPLTEITKENIAHTRVYGDFRT
jgi:hypothetical protein